MQGVCVMKNCFLRHYVLSITTSLCFVVFLQVFDYDIYYKENSLRSMENVSKGKQES